MLEVAKPHTAWLAKCTLKTKWGSLIPRPLKMSEGLSTSKRQAEDEKWLVAHIYLPMLLFNLTITIVELIPLRSAGKKNDFTENL